MFDDVLCVIFLPFRHFGVESATGQPTTIGATTCISVIGIRRLTACGTPKSTAASDAGDPSIATKYAVFCCGSRHLTSLPLSGSMTFLLSQVLMINDQQRAVRVVQHSVPDWSDDLFQVRLIAGADNEQLHRSAVLSQVVQNARRARPRTPPGHPDSVASNGQADGPGWQASGDRRLGRALIADIADPACRQVIARSGELHNRASSIAIPSKAPSSADPWASTTIQCACRAARSPWPRMTATGQCADTARAAAVEPTRPGWKWCAPTAPIHTMAADAEARINEVIARSWVISTSILTGLSAASTAMNA